jgi:hypothetical protein
VPEWQRVSWRYSFLEDRLGWVCRASKKSKRDASLARFFDMISRQQILLTWVSLEQRLANHALRGVSFAFAKSNLEDDPVTSTSPPLLGRPGEPGRVHWPAVLAAVSASFALVAGVFAWIATHPHKAALPLQAMKVTALPAPASPPPPQAPAFSATPAFYHSAPKKVIASNIPLMEENPPSLPPPASLDRRDAGAAKGPPKPPAGETYGTQVLFLNNRETAADAARHEHKLLFVMHISGNFEDSCFT